MVKSRKSAPHRCERTAGGIALRTLGAFATAAVGVAGYASLVERNRFTLRRFDIPVLQSGSKPLTILHISDLHLTAAQRRKQEWISGLANLNPDLVVNTGDTIAGHDAVEPALKALAPLFDRPGVFVFGSNDYFAPKPKNPLRYFKNDRRPVSADPLPWADLRDGMAAGGWLDLNNSVGTLEVAGRRISFAGVDDPHIRHDRFEKIAGKLNRQAALNIGVSHSPEPRVVNQFADEGYQLVLCGHTHGGQVRIPFYGALVSNCDLPPSKCRWVQQWNEDTWLHISAGLGTSPYAPYRLACPPEATLLRLTSK